jgi:hypothetical protein
MKTSTILFSLAVILMSATISQAAGILMQTGFTGDWWSDNKDNDARQFSVPFRIEGRAGDFSATLLTAYTDTRLNPSGSDSVSLGHLLDTKLVTSYQIIGKLPVDILLGLDFNLPTGKTNLSSSQLSLIMDPDLVSINNFGEGFNINPTITLAKEWGNWVAGLAFGYLWRGEYDFSNAIGATDYSPGDVITINGEARYYFMQNLHARLFAGHSWYGKNEMKGVNFFQEGDFTLAGIGANYTPVKQWTVDVAFRGIFREKSKFLSAPGLLSTETDNIHGDEWIADLAVRYLLDDKTALGSFFQGRWYTKNSYPENLSRFIGAREKYSLGFKATRAFTSHLEAGLDVRGFLKHDDQTNFPNYQPERHFSGFSVALLLTGKF